MDRDSRENIVDPIERVSPPSGNDDTGETGGQSVRIHKEREGQSTEPETRKRAIGSRQDGEDPNQPTDLLSERGNPGLHGGSGDPGWKP